MLIDEQGSRHHAREPTPLERRLHPRYPLSPFDSLRVRIQPCGSPSRPAVAVDISRGGVRLSVSDELEVGVACAVRFPESDERFRPKTVLGTVRRLDPDTEGYVAAIEFAEPLASLRLESGQPGWEADPPPTGITGARAQSST